MIYGIYVLTTAERELINGMIASWVTQVSYDPPMIMVAVHPDRYSHQLIEKSGFFAIHLISSDQKLLVSRFKRPDPEAKFTSLDWSRGKTGCPILQDCLGYFECTVKAKFSPGNHTMFVGEILEARMLSSGRPMSTLDYPGLYLGEV